MPKDQEQEKLDLIQEWAANAVLQAPAAEYGVSLHTVAVEARPYSTLGHTGLELAVGGSSNGTVLDADEMERVGHMLIGAARGLRLRLEAAAAAAAIKEDKGGE